MKESGIHNYHDLITTIEGEFRGDDAEQYRLIYRHAIKTVYGEGLTQISCDERHKFVFDKFICMLVDKVLSNNFPPELQALGLNLRRTHFVEYLTFLLNQYNTEPEDDIEDGEFSSEILSDGQWRWLKRELHSALCSWVSDEHIIRLASPIINVTQHFVLFVAFETLALIAHRLNNGSDDFYLNDLNFYYRWFAQFYQRKKYDSKRKDRNKHRADNSVAVGNNLNAEQILQIKVLLDSVSKQAELLTLMQLCTFSKALHLAQQNGEGVETRNIHSRLSFIAFLLQACDNIKDYDLQFSEQYKSNVYQFKGLCKNEQKVGELGCSRGGRIEQGQIFSCRSFMWGEKSFLNPIRDILSQSVYQTDFTHIVISLWTNPLPSRQTNRRGYAVGYEHDDIRLKYRQLAFLPSIKIIGPIYHLVSKLFYPSNELVESIYLAIHQHITGEE